MPSTALADTLEAISKGENKGDKKTKDKENKGQDKEKKTKKKTKDMHSLWKAEIVLQYSHPTNSDL